MLSLLFFNMMFLHPKFMASIMQTLAVLSESNFSSEYKSIKQQVVWRHKPLVNNNRHAVKKHRPKGP
ncbi:hypothetical protein N7494_003748 [Penicillium frequentans]|uniref:Uncharacterized protein n=1 Tax=Penicillium frequentans TaxID=3151616 RepID=A0AAD6GI73_9EURO|nr:hypothetical protein N7494_003748 [Penicillium glabrum]